MDERVPQLGEVLEGGRSAASEEGPVERDERELVKPVPGNPSEAGRQAHGAGLAASNPNGIPSLVAEGMSMTPDFRTGFDLQCVLLSEQSTESISGGFALADLATR